MKKLIAFTLALVLILAAIPALAEFDGMTLEDLQAQAARIRAEILRREEKPFIVYPGEYQVGLDIPAGIYRVEMDGGLGASFDVYSGGLLDFSAYMDVDPDIGSSVIGKVELKAGQTVEIGGTVIFRLYTGIQP